MCVCVCFSLWVDYQKVTRSVVSKNIYKYNFFFSVAPISGVNFQSNLCTRKCTHPTPYNRSLTVSMKGFLESETNRLRRWGYFTSVWGHFIYFTCETEDHGNDGKRKVVSRISLLWIMNRPWRTCLLSI